MTKKKTPTPVDAKRVYLFAEIAEPLHHAVKVRAVQNRRTMAQEVTALIEYALEHVDKEGARG